MKTKKWLQFLTGGIAIVTLVMALSSMSGVSAAQNNSNIGIVDMEKLQNELPDYQGLQSTLKEKESGFKHFQGYLLSQHRAELKELQDKATSEKNGKSAEAQAEIEKRFQDEVKKKNDATNDQLEKERAKIMQDLNDQKKKVDERTKTLISEVAGDQKISAVFDKNAVLFGGEDITDKVIAKAKKQDKKDDKQEKKDEKKDSKKDAKNKKK